MPLWSFNSIGHIPRPNQKRSLWNNVSVRSCAGTDRAFPLLESNSPALLVITAQCNAPERPVPSPRQFRTAEHLKRWLGHAIES